MSYNKNYIRKEIKGKVKETDKAYLLKMVDDKNIWFPKSQCRNLESNNCEITEFALTQKGYMPDEFYLKEGLTITKCMNCGKNIREGYKYCYDCNKKMKSGGVSDVNLEGAVKYVKEKLASMTIIFTEEGFVVSLDIKGSHEIRDFIVRDNCRLCSEWGFVDKKTKECLICVLTNDYNYLLEGNY